MNDARWDQVSALAVFLHKPSEATRKMQEYLTLGNVLKDEIICYSDCRNTSQALWPKAWKTLWSGEKQSCLRKTEKRFASCLLRSPVYRIMLTDNRQVSAKEGSAIRFQGTWVYIKVGKRRVSFSVSIVHQWWWTQHLGKLKKSKSTRLESVEHSGYNCQTKMLFSVLCMKRKKSDVRQNCVFSRPYNATL